MGIRHAIGLVRGPKGTVGILVSRRRWLPFCASSLFFLLQHCIGYA